MFAKVNNHPGFEGTASSHLHNPRVPLPEAMEHFLEVDAVIVTHLHPDHRDEAAQSALPKSLPVFAQNDEDAEIIRAQASPTCVR